MESVKANELRIGSKLLFCVERRINPISRVVEVWEIRPTRILVKDKGLDVAFEIGDESLRPIPLTPEILVKAGFTYRSDHRGEGCIMDFDHGDWKKSLSVAFDYEKNGGGWIMLGQGRINYQYVHQLQNLYFALTGNELTLKL